MNRFEAILAIKKGHRIRSSDPSSFLPSKSGYFFSYDGLMVSVITDEGKTESDFELIDKLDLPSGGSYEIVDSFNMEIDDFLETFTNEKI